MKQLTVPERLIVAADFKPTLPGNQGRMEVANRTIRLAQSLKDTGIYIKMNTSLRACGYDLIDHIQGYGIKVFADLKLFDIKETLSTDGMFLRETKPEILTVACFSGIPAMKALKAELPDTEILGVSVLTNFTNQDCDSMFTFSTENAVKWFARFIADAGMDGFISAAPHAAMLKEKFGMVMSCNSPAIRPDWAIVKGDDQDPSKIVTPTIAIRGGVDRIVVGRTIVNDKDPYAAVMRTLEEISAAL